MAREVRITIDDDEVFERMKTRKRDLDLSWKEVLKRGLGDESGEEFDEDAFIGLDLDAARRAMRDDRVPDRGGDDAAFDDVVTEFKQSIRDQVRESLMASVDAMDGPGHSPASRGGEVGRGGLDREMSELAAAEDAVLRFDAVTGDDRRYAVPLRVQLETSRDGLDVEVVAVREGKSASGTNRFDRETRRAVNEHLARGGTGTLTFDGVEQYEVGPVISWTRDDDGNPIVSDVDIEEVLFDE